ncbi:MAG: class I SAM-dependent methyltransferase, partial [bacterium]
GSRELLTRVGLLDATRELRDSIVSLKWFRSNAGFWLRGSRDGLPIPPLRLVRLATGTSSLAWSFHSGALAAESIGDVLERNRIDIRNLRSILDFGCGYGRVVRQWAGLQADVHGCDYNPRSVRWCRRTLPFAAFETNALQPPLPYRNDSFDLVYALSVFTHLPAPLLRPWMGEMARVLKPGGFLVITTHGEAYFDELTADEQHQFRSALPVVKGEDAAGTNRCGVYFSEQYIRNGFSRGFRVVDFVPRGAKGNPHQDLVLLQKL